MTDKSKSLTYRHYDVSSEIDLRAEFNQFVNGGDGEPIRGQDALIWIADPTKRLASFKDRARHYPETNPSVDYLISGFVHTQIMRKVWLGFTGGRQDAFPHGKIDPTTAFIYVEHDVFQSVRVASLSEVWTLVLDSDGNPIRENSDYVRDIRWKIEQSIPFREQQARTEFWRLHCERQDV